MNLRDLWNEMVLSYAKKRKIPISIIPIGKAKPVKENEYVESQQVIIDIEEEKNDDGLIW